MTEEFIDLTRGEDVYSETTEMEIEVSETIGWTNGKCTVHHDLDGRNDPEQHTIGAITGLREELDSLEKLRSLYSDKANVANYYEWTGDALGAGYFVSLSSNVSVTLCRGSNVFGVTVNDAAFIGLQEATPKGNSYALVVTSGLVDVRCTDEVAINTYVTSNEDGMAVPTKSACGYRVVATETKADGFKYATIALGVQADVTDVIDQKVQFLDKQLQAVDSNALDAANRANEAYKKLLELENSNREISGKVDNAIDVVDKNTEVVGSLNDKVSDVEGKMVSVEAIVANAENHANQAMSDAEEAWAKAENLKEEEYSLRTHIDKYCVGEYSQTYGLTLEQAIAILPKGSIYAPTFHSDTEGGKHIEDYIYTNKPIEVDQYPSELDNTKVYYITTENLYYYYNITAGWQSSETLPVYSREFTPEFLYMWGDLGFGRCGWITVDKNYDSVGINDSAKSVYFRMDEPAIAEGDHWGYWYTDGDDDHITDRNGNTGVYRPYSLYKWMGDHWEIVATLAGNVNSRMIGITNLATNNASFEIYNARGSAATLGARITDTESQVGLMSRWAKGKDEDGKPLYNLAIIDVSADADGSSLSLIVANENGNKAIDGASIVMGQNEGEASYVKIDASQIYLDGEVQFASKREGEDRTYIDGANIRTGSIDASTITTGTLGADVVYTGKISASTLQSENYTVEDGKTTLGMKLTLTDGKWDSPNLRISEDGSIDCSNITINDGVIQSGDYMEQGIPGDEPFELIFENPTLTTKTVTQKSANGQQYIYTCVLKGQIEIDTEYVPQQVELVDATVLYHALNMQNNAYVSSNAQLTSAQYSGRTVSYTIEFDTEYLASTLKPKNFWFDLKISGKMVKGYQCISGAKIYMDEMPEIKFPYFSVDKDGVVANQGKIGGYTLKDNVLTSGTKENTVILDASDEGAYAFSAGHEAPVIAPFSVTKDGIMSVVGGSFSGDIVASKCSIGPITFNNKSFNVSQITVSLSGFSDTGAKLFISARLGTHSISLVVKANYNRYYNGSWYVDSQTFDGSISPRLNFNNATKVIYTKPSIAWTLTEIKEKSLDISTLLASGDWEERAFSSFVTSPITSNSYLWLHQGSAVVFADDENNFIAAYHFPLMTNLYGDASENILTISDTSAGIVCGGGTFDSNPKPGFYLGTDGFRMGETGSDVRMDPKGEIRCKKIIMRDSNDNPVDLLTLVTKIKELEDRIKALES